MARDYEKKDALVELATRRHNLLAACTGTCIAAVLFLFTPFSNQIPSTWLLIFFGFIPAAAAVVTGGVIAGYRWVEQERVKESQRRGGKPVLGLPPQREAVREALEECREDKKIMIDRYLVGFELDSGSPIWVTDDELCTHACVFAKTGVGKTLWLESLMFQQMARGRASGFTFIDAKRDPGTLADIIMMALMTGRIEDVIVVDPFDPVCAYNFVFTTQRPDVKARKILRCGLPPTSDQSTTKHYDRLAADAVARVVRAMESFGLAWSVRDVAVALSAFNVAYPRMRELLHEQGAKEAMVELGHLASSYRTAKGGLDSARLTDNLRGIASELHSISNSEAGEMFCSPRADLSLTDAILRGKIIYYMLPRLEEAESAARMVKVFREDLEVSIGEITSSRTHRLEDPHMVMIDEGASTFGPTWANLFELARKGRFALLFGAQSVGGLMDETMGLSEQFYERVIANVNLKVIMRVGDNRTAEDMAEWIGLVTKTKKAIATGFSSSLNARQLTKHLEVNKRAADGVRDGITLTEDEDYLVSAEELKHEMSAEKGLAWFDKGDGRLRKGRALWFEADLPSTWEGREFLTRYESVEADEIGLAEWVDEHILSIERAETEKSLYGSPQPPSSGSSASGSESSRSSSEGSEEPAEESGPYRFNLFRPFRGKMRANMTVTQATPPAPPAVTETTSATVQQDQKTEHNPVESSSQMTKDAVVETPAQQKVAEVTMPEQPRQGESRQKDSSSVSPTNGRAGNGSGGGRPQQRNETSGNQAARPVQQRSGGVPGKSQENHRPNGGNSHTGRPAGGGLNFRGKKGDTVSTKSGGGEGRNDGRGEGRSESRGEGRKGS